tara:strand:+ start:393 stop:566 length:174 start_codon:yes stop_codon:yes gene_type:complete
MSGYSFASMMLALIVATISVLIFGPAAALGITALWAGCLFVFGVLLVLEAHNDDDGR